MKKKVLVLLAEGFEEMEVVIPADLCKRAGIDVLIAGVGALDVSGAHGISLIADRRLNDVGGKYDAVIVPGGMPGAANIAGSSEAVELIKEYFASGRLVCAICAAPAVVLNAAGILSGKKAVCFPGFEKEFGSDVKFVQERVVVDGNIITAKGPGAAAEFAEAIISALAGKDIAAKTLAMSFFR